MTDSTIHHSTTAAPRRATPPREPAWLAAARARLGMREAPGAADSATILGWAQALGARVVGMIYNHDSTPWCGLFVAICLREGAPAVALPAIAVRASSWDAWGVASKPCLGAVLRFAREGGGHVGFAVGEDDAAYHVLGGNQGDRVSVVRIARERLVACRVPAGWSGARLPLPRMAAVAGGALSHDEA